MPKHSFKKLSMLARCAIVLGATIMFAFFLCLIMGAVAQSSDNPAENLTLYGEAAYLASMLFCGLVGAKIADEKKFASGVLSSGIMLFCIICASIIFGGDSLIKELLLALLGAFISAVGSLLGAREGKRKRRR